MDEQILGILKDIKGTLGLIAVWTFFTMINTCGS